MYMWLVHAQLQSTHRKKKNIGFAISFNYYMVNSVDNILLITLTYYYFFYIIIYLFLKILYLVFYKKCQEHFRKFFTL